ncbi:Ig-like domain-containing protein [Mycolicibacterium sp.]|uniref:Ig-like domain-containing protein n=1 Tax=Mycolicibacterium sp. TaxID=2320850 RepID=UPI0025F0DED8|nr:Ig-like domain-containing protein [Mycolicibacterium sp.]MCB9409562.1 hypothetical protein [Mycolicibacterium sp.]
MNRKSMARVVIDAGPTLATAVYGHVTITDPDGEYVYYEIVPDQPGGWIRDLETSDEFDPSVSLDHNTGEFVFTPGTFLRENAYLAAGITAAQHLTFTAAGTDLEGTATTTVTVPISALAPPAPPTTAPTAVPPAWTDEAAITTIPVESGAMTLSPDGSRIYIRNDYSGSYTDYRGVSVINTATNARNAIATDLDFGGVSADAAVAVSPNGRYIYTAGAYFDPNGNDPNSDYVVPTVKVIDTTTNRVSAAIPLSGDATITNLAVDNDGTNLYVREIDATGNSSLTVIDLPSKTVIATIPVGSRQSIYTGAGLAVGPDNKHVYIRETGTGSGAASTLRVINTATKTVTATITTGEPTGYGNTNGSLTVSPNGDYVYTRDWSINDTGDLVAAVTVINTSNNTVTAVIPTGDRFGSTAGGIAVSPEGSHLYVADNDGIVGAGIQKIDLATNQITGIADSGQDSSSYRVGDVSVSDGSTRLYTHDTYFNPATGTWIGGVTVIDSTKLAFPARDELAPDDSTNTLENRAVTLSPMRYLLGGDTGGTITAVSAPANGTAVFGDTIITYTPNTDYAGTDTFTYTATDGIRTDTGTITVDVYEVNHTVSTDPGPFGTDDLYSRLRDAMDGKDGKTLRHGVYTEHVFAGGQQALIVYIAGTHTLTGDQSVIKNLPSAAGIVDEDQIAVIKDAMKTNEPILLVGYSQGGMDAQNIAADAAKYGLQGQIKAVVTFGSPLVRYDKYPTVHLEDVADVIPTIAVPAWGIGLFNFAVNRSVYKIASRNSYNPLVLGNPLSVGVHGERSTYEDIGLFFDVDTSSQWDGVKDALAGFLRGRIVPDGYAVIGGELVKVGTPSSIQF